MTNNALLRVEHLKKYFPVRKGIFSSFASGAKRSYVRAVDDISFTLQEEEILGFVGESGCGKSTMSRAILRLTEPTDGKVFFRDREIISLGKKAFKAYRPKCK
jgi:ABC-type oligopeptide transport system ATPase subunit